jgi:hypothetical protein
VELISELRSLYWIWSNSPSLLAQIIVALPFTLWGFFCLWALGLWASSK